MNELATINQTMTSREIAEYTGKRHSDVLEAIRSMEPAWEKVNGRKFPLVEYRDAKGEMRPEYKLSKTECLYVATKFNDEARALLIIRWENLERQNALDFTNPNTVLMLAQNWAKAEQEKNQLEEANEIQAKELKAAEPKVIFADSVVASNDSVLIGELARILKQNGIEIGQNRLFEWMRQKGYLCSKGNLYNQPTQTAMDLGLFEIKKTTINRPDADPIIQTTTKVTGKGQIYFVNKFLYNKSKAQ